MRTGTPYVATVAMAAALAVIFLVPVACSPREEAAPAPPSAEPPAQTTPETQPSSPPVEPSSPPDASPTPPPSTAPPSTASASPPAAATQPPAAPEPSDSQPASSADGVVDPGGEIAVEATRPGATRVGAAKCGVCHKPQYASWSETAHAKREPPLDCESCHGPGSEYKSLSVMKDPEKARAAGLVLPDATFCATCHRQGWTDDLLQKAHAHKEPAKS